MKFRVSAIPISVGESMVRSKYIRVFCLMNNPDLIALFSARYGLHLSIEYFTSLGEIMTALDAKAAVDIIVADEGSDGWELLSIIRKRRSLKTLPVVLLVDRVNKKSIQRAKSDRADDIFSLIDEQGDLLLRLNYLSKRDLYKAPAPVSQSDDIEIEFEIPWWKRTIDIVFSSLAIIVLFPILLLVAILIRLDSKGPIVYKSKRVGSGYRVFDLYKFRTMRTDADQLLSKMGHLNMYKKSSPAENSERKLCDACKGAGSCQQLLFYSNKKICEKEYKKRKDGAAAFLKFQNDPRITRLGRFLRNTSLDEIPQLFNVLKGDMSLVGNRPLPLYEAEKLTTDNKILRFAGPGGLTGLWQVTKRGKSGVSEEERVQLDITYAKNFSFFMDILIVLRTLPALFQSENV